MVNDMYNSIFNNVSVDIQLIDGIPIDIEIIGKGDAGVSGKTAYESAVEGGYPGTEEEFAVALAAINNLGAALHAKQETLVSGTNIKTIDGKSILGAGDLTVDKTYVHSQIQPSNRWEINHMLNKKPSVKLFNSFSQEVIGEVIYESLNRVVINYSGSFSGEAILN